MMAGSLSSETAWLMFGVLALAIVDAIWARLGPEIPAARPSRKTRAAERTPIVWRAVLAYESIRNGKPPAAPAGLSRRPMRSFRAVSYSPKPGQTD